jgi:hypothetical protein
MTEVYLADIRDDVAQFRDWLDASALTELPSYTVGWAPNDCRSQGCDGRSYYGTGGLTPGSVYDLLRDEERRLADCQVALAIHQPECHSLTIARVRRQMFHARGLDRAAGQIVRLDISSRELTVGRESSKLQVYTHDQGSEENTVHLGLPGLEQKSQGYMRERYLREQSEARFVLDAMRTEITGVLSLWS